MSKHSSKRSMKNQENLEGALVGGIVPVPPIRRNGDQKNSAANAVILGSAESAAPSECGRMRPFANRPAFVRQACLGMPSLPARNPAASIPAPPEVPGRPDGHFGGSLEEPSFKISQNWLTAGEGEPAKYVGC